MTQQRDEDYAERQTYAVENINRILLWLLALGLIAAVVFVLSEGF